MYAQQQSDDETLTPQTLISSTKVFYTIFNKLGCAAAWLLENMLHIKTLNEGLDIFKALGSEIRVKIIETLLENNGMNMNELASALNISNSALTGHIKKLEDCRLVAISSEPSRHGNQKICTVHLDKILVEINSEDKTKDIYEIDIKVGHYSDYVIYPTCGLASSEALIGKWTIRDILRTLTI